MTPPNLASSLAVLACPHTRPQSSAPLDRLKEANAGTHLDVGDALEVGDEILDEALPCREALDEDVRGAQLEGAWWVERGRGESVPGTLACASDPSVLLLRFFVRARTSPCAQSEIAVPLAPPPPSSPSSRQPYPSTRWTDPCSS